METLILQFSYDVVYALYISTHSWAPRIPPLKAPILPSVETGKYVTVSSDGLRARHRAPDMEKPGCVVGI